MDLSTEERQEILKNVLGDTLIESNKHLVAEALEFLNYLLQLLRESKINMHELKQFFGFHIEKLKNDRDTLTSSSESPSNINSGENQGSQEKMKCLWDYRSWKVTLLVPIAALISDY